MWYKLPLTKVETSVWYPTHSSSVWETQRAVASAMSQGVDQLAPTAASEATSDGEASTHEYFLLRCMGFFFFKFVSVY